MPEARKCKKQAENEGTGTLLIVLSVKEENSVIKLTFCSSVFLEPYKIVRL